jgi:hypothetical protein
VVPADDNRLPQPHEELGAFELRLPRADADWVNSWVGFALFPTGAGTLVRFYRRGWPLAEHYRISCHCWVLSLGVMQRYLEDGETARYERRLEV